MSNHTLQNAAPATRQEVTDALASMVIQQAAQHGFMIEIDAIRDAVEQVAKFAGIAANEAEFQRASQKVEDEARITGRLAEVSGTFVGDAEYVQQHGECQRGG